MKDLVVMVADLDAEESLREILNRPHSLGIRRIDFEIIRHPERDPGCYNNAHNILRSQANNYEHALIIFDHHGSGHDNLPIDELQQEIEERLYRNGWERDRNCVIVIEPELEAWVWSNSLEVDKCLGWENRRPTLRDWLIEQGYLEAGDQKPTDPKEAMVKALREVQVRHTAVIFKRLAASVSLNRCTDPSFQRLKSILQDWFSE